MEEFSHLPVYEVLCPYCNVQTERTCNETIYGKRYGFGLVYLCNTCGAYVGCHKSGEPLGAPANKETRYWRSLAHTHFDQLWMVAKNRSKVRRKWYQRLARYMGIEEQQSHIGMFDMEQCKKVLLFVDFTQNTK